MAEPTELRPGSAGQIRTGYEPGRPPADVVELIMADHRRIRRLGEALRDMSRWDDGACPGVWQRLASLLEAHTWAEEEICYLSMFGSRPQAVDGRREAVADHDDIRQAICEASLHPAGTVAWWRAVRAVMTTATEHFHREERMLADRLPHLTTRWRYELGSQWTAFMAASRLDASLQEQEAATGQRPRPAHRAYPGRRHREHAEPIPASFDRNRGSYRL